MFQAPNTLLLNASFEPLRVVHWQRAFGLVFSEKVEILEEYRNEVRSMSNSYRVPAVIKLNRWINLKHLPPMVRFSRINVYLRDGFQCQYCGVKCQEKLLTMDHVLPVVRGGKRTWENIVTACKKCNQDKGHRTPEQAGLTLMKEPKKPRWLPGKYGLTRNNRTPRLWMPYLALQKRLAA